MSTEPASPAQAGQGAEGQVSPPAQPNPEASATPPEPPPEPFYKSLKDETLRGYAELKGYKQTDGVAFSEALLKSYQNLEKLRGVPAERLLTLPENLEDAEAMGPIRERLGFAPPKEAKEYGFATVEGVDPNRATVLEGLAHKHGVPAKMAQGFFQELAQLEKAEITAQETKYAEELAAEKSSLKSDLGDKWDAFLETARRAQRRFGLDDEGIAALEDSLGYAKAMRYFAQVGEAMGEAPVIGAEKKDSAFMGPEAAKVRIAELKSNQEWVGRYLAGDKAAQAEMRRLQEIAHPGVKTS